MKFNSDSQSSNKHNSAQALGIANIQFLGEDLETLPDTPPLFKINDELFVLR